MNVLHLHRKRPAPPDLLRCPHHGLEFQGTCADCQRARSNRWATQLGAVGSTVVEQPGGRLHAA